MSQVGFLSIFLSLSIVVFLVIYRLYLYVQTGKIVKKLSSVMATEMNIVLLEKKVIEIINVFLGASSADFILLSDFVKRPVGSLNLEGTAPFKYAALEQMFHQVKKTLNYEKLTDKVMRDLFVQLNLRLMLPLKVGDEDVGLFVLGPKSKGGRYSSSDIKFLESISPQLSLALKNTDSYRKIQEFSRTLETKIIERTHELESAQAAQLKLKDEFVFIATHDLATPVTAISGFTALINNRKEPISPDLANYLSAISEASNRLKVLVNDLLQIARSDSGTIKVELSTVDAGKIIEAAAREITPLATEKKVKIILNLSSDNTIQADPIKLSEIIENLLSNGVKYNKEGGSITISSVVKDTNLLVDITDTGIGIPLSEQPKVFTKFFRSETPEARSRPGTGLGLFVARMLTEKLGGKITFNSTEDQGTTFRLIFNR